MHTDVRWPHNHQTKLYNRSQESGTLKWFIKEKATSNRTFGNMIFSEELIPATSLSLFTHHHIVPNIRFVS